ncbi:trypsin-like peptidase domain-containing protein [Streptomyces ovatisporus]|uniref:Trypsin-like peptidase domain-containing protein n=1 Tax=Streptomyces ovatisporus TaxID=1128682 RepID=A0ABV9A6A9_9ACTN
MRICDLAGRPRGSGFFADHSGTVITSHEAVDGLGRLVVHAPDGRSHLAKAHEIIPLPERDLALIRTEGLRAAPLVIGDGQSRAAGTAVRLRTGHTPARPSSSGAGCWTDAQLAGKTCVTYTSTDRFYTLNGVMELAMPEAAAVELHLSSRASGSPVVDAATGAVLGVLGTALHTPDRTACFAVPLIDVELWESEGELQDVLARNAETVPGYGPDLNPAGVLALTEESLKPVAERARLHVRRPRVADALRRFPSSDASVVALVGRPGTGRSTELAALAAQCSGDATPAVWLRGAALRAGDGSVREAVGRALAEAARTVAAGSGVSCASGARGLRLPAGEESAWERAPSADVVARLARDGRRPLLVLLDAPEEMPAALFQELRQWITGTASWLRASGARMVLACGPELWEQAGEFFPRTMLHAGQPEAGAAVADATEGSALPPCVRLGPLPSGAAAQARERYGLDEYALAESDRGHPLAMRMLAEVRAALGVDARKQRHGATGVTDDTGIAGAPAGTCGAPGEGLSAQCDAPVPPPAHRSELFSAHLDLTALRIARRVAVAQGRTEHSGDVRRLAARAAGALHEAARRCLGMGRGAVARADLAEVFPQTGGWASAVLTEGVLEPAGNGFRFADEEFADWLQGRHLDLDASLAALVHSQDGTTAAVTVPRHRIGPVVQALLLCSESAGPESLQQRLLPLTAVCFAEGRPEGSWWASRLLLETLLRVPDAQPYSRVLRALAEHIGVDGRTGVFGPWFWRRVGLPAARKTELLRLMLPADPPHGTDDDHGPERFLDVVGDLLAAEPRAVQPLLCAWFTDRRKLDCRADAGCGPSPTVASAAQALLYAHRAAAPGQLLDLLIDACHPHADELLGEVAQDEPTELCRAVERWAADDRSLRRVAAAEYGLRLAVGPARTGSDGEAARRTSLQHAAMALLERPAEQSLHEYALALLLRVDDDWERHLDAALDKLAATGAPVLSDALTAALRERSEAVLAAFRRRLCQPGSGTHHLVGALANVRDPDLARPTAELVREYAELRPERAGEPLAAFVRLRLTHRGGGRAGLETLVDALLTSPYGSLRASLARMLAAVPEDPVRDELLDVLLLGECDLDVLDAALAGALEAAAHSGTADEPEGERPAAPDAEDRPGASEPFCAGQGQGELVRRLGLLMARTPEGAACYDRRLTGLARERPDFGRLLRSWAAAEPAAWTAVAGAVPGAWTAVAGPGVRGASEALADCV